MCSSSHAYGAAGSRWMRAPEPKTKVVAAVRTEADSYPPPPANLAAIPPAVADAQAKAAYNRWLSYVAEEIRAYSPSPIQRSLPPSHGLGEQYASLAEDAQRLDQQAAVCSFFANPGGGVQNPYYQPPESKACGSRAVVRIRVVRPVSQNRARSFVWVKAFSGTWQAVPKVSGKRLRDT